MHLPTLVTKVIKLGPLGCCGELMGELSTMEAALTLAHKHVGDLCRDKEQATEANMAPILKSAVAVVVRYQHFAKIAAGMLRVSKDSMFIECCACAVCVVCVECVVCVVCSVCVLCAVCCVSCVLCVSCVFCVCMCRVRHVCVVC